MKKHERTVKKACLFPKEGLCLWYYLKRLRRGYRYLEVVAEDENGRRSEKSGGLPCAGGWALSFFHLAVTAAVTPYTLVEVYDEFLLRITQND